jgi:squalene-hopene/tetraprenyl-beta-curcumene cyclase
MVQAELLQAVRRAAASLARRQRPDGHWLFPLEADATIPADYVLLQHYLDRIDDGLNARIGTYLRRIQSPGGGWPQYTGGSFDLSVSVKAYFALKAVGDATDAPHMLRARERILEQGGAEQASVFVRIQLALFGVVPWNSLPAMPVEILLLTRWFPVTIWRVAYWSRTFIVPLVVLQALRPTARNPRKVAIDEIFRTPPDQVQVFDRARSTSTWSHLFRLADTLLRWVEPYWPRGFRRRAIAAAVSFVEERLNGEDGLGAIYPPMAYALMMFDALGYSPDHPLVATAWRALHRLVIVEGQEAYCQPCVSPVWDTALVGHALRAATDCGAGDYRRAVTNACNWLAGRQVTQVRGDWAVSRPRLAPGGWAFQYRNDHYPDLDDTAIVALLLHADDEARYQSAVERARRWIAGMQGRAGAWGAFDVDNDRHVLNHVPFADHGALLDPPTADVTARCLSLLATLGRTEDAPHRARALAWLRQAQEQDGSWFGRWGLNHIYGTWSVLEALSAAKVAPSDTMVRRAVAWFRTIQRDDGGWGEDARSYEAAAYVEAAESLASQTAWAMLGLMAAGETGPALSRGAEFLVRMQGDGDAWPERLFNATGFPRVLALKYHGYPVVFPLLALARYTALHSNPRSESAQQLCSVDTC